MMGALAAGLALGRGWDETLVDRGRGGRGQLPSPRPRIWAQAP